MGTTEAELREETAVLYYPKSAGSRDCPGGRCLAFEKYDGTNRWMAKIKTSAYMAKLKAAFAERWEDYWE